jgi:nucleotide-binding universal stress UspA family protein
VVIGLDGSDTSWDAFWWGCGEARRLSACAVAVFVSPTIDASAGLASAVGCPCDYTEIDRRATEWASELEREVHRHAAERGLDLRFLHAHGDPAQELLRVAATLKCDLIVVGRSAKVLHRLAGSLGRRLIGTSRAPVVTVVP